MPITITEVRSLLKIFGKIQQSVESNNMIFKITREILELKDTITKTKTLKGRFYSIFNTTEKKYCNL